MFNNQFSEVCFKKSIYVQSCVVLLTCILSYLVFSFSVGLIILLSYIVCLVLIQYAYGDHFQTFVLGFFERKKIQANQPSKKCTICLKSSCNQHTKFPLSSEPWKGIFIPKQVDEALEEFFEITFEKYIYFWYRNISTNPMFLGELKMGTRYLVAVLMQRFNQIDLAKVILQRLIHVGISHLDCFIRAKKRKGKNLTKVSALEDMVFEEYGSNLHIAVYNRNSELNYLRSLSKCILPYLIPKQHLNSMSVSHLVREILSGSILLSIMDSLADPDFINLLLLHLFDKDPIVTYPPSNCDGVPILEHFALSSYTKPSSRLHADLSSNLKELNCLYPLMQFLKDEGAVNVLQFCLAVDDFNRTLLNPELNLEEIQELHSQAKKLYFSYMSPEAVDRIDFNSEIIEEFKKIVEGMPQDIIRLQTTEPLYKMYEYTFNLLEEKYFPQFFQSDEFMKYICGERNPSALSRNPTKIRKKGDYASKIGEKLLRIRGVFQPASTIEGQLEEDLSSEDSVFEAEEMKYEDLDSAFGDMDDLGLRDLSAWRVSVPKVREYRDENDRQVCVFVIDVQRIDVTNKDNPDKYHWVVERQYHEFYVLENKLTEFHGELVDIHLPTKKSFGSKNADYLDSRRAAFEEFLQRLLQRPNFRSSELLFNFLSSTGDFTMGFLPDINLGKMIKTVPSKLLKEKGQHLEPFLQAFIASSESSRAKLNTKGEIKDIYVQSCNLSPKLKRSLFKDNAGRKLDRVAVAELATRQSILSVNGVFDYFLYLGLKVFAVPSWIIQMAVSLQQLLGRIIETFVESYLSRNLQQAFVPQRLVQLIHLIRDVVYFRDTQVKRSRQEKLQRAEETLTRMKGFLPRAVIVLLGRESYEEGIWCLLEIFQHPRLNKQLAYSLLDVVTLELFPELATTEEQDEVM